MATTWEEGTGRTCKPQLREGGGGREMAAWNRNKGLIEKKTQTCSGWLFELRISQSRVDESYCFWSKVLLDFGLQLETFSGGYNRKIQKLPHRLVEKIKESLARWGCYHMFRYSRSPTCNSSIWCWLKAIGKWLFFWIYTPILGNHKQHD